VIESYRFGHVEINGRAYTSDVIIYPDHVDASWRRQEGHRLGIADLKEALAARPEVLIVGTGAHGLMRVDEEVEEHLARLGVELRALSTDEACKQYNDIASHKRVVAALHLTC